MGLYLKIRELVLRGDFNKAKKEILSGITLELGIKYLIENNGPF